MSPSVGPQRHQTCWSADENTFAAFVRMGAIAPVVGYLFSTSFDFLAETFWCAMIIAQDVQ
jgi:hypothetical protein